MALLSYKWFVSKFLLVSIVFLCAGYLPHAGPAQKKRLPQKEIPRHPFYVSVTEINHNAKDKTLEISCKLFTSDLEAVLEKALHTKVDLSSASDKKTADGYIAAYVMKNLQLKVDGKMVALQFVGSEKEQDATWSYFQISNIASVKKIDLVNSLLYDGFDKEINIMHVSVGGERKSGKVEYPQTGISFDW